MKFMELEMLDPLDSVEHLPEHEFDTLPPAARDVDAVDPYRHKMTEPSHRLHLSDPCHYCGAFNMTVGDYMFLGSCVPCYEGAVEKANHS